MRLGRTAYPSFLLLVLVAFVPVASSAELTEVARIDAAAWSYVVFAVAVTLVKIAALIVGYLVVKLGYTTMMAGVQGKDSIEMKFANARFGFKGVTPGLALGVVGVLMMIWALSTKQHFTTEASSSSGRVDHREGTTQLQEMGKPGTAKNSTGNAEVQKAPKF